jgi:arachidonate 5-lipoxygenase
MKKIEVKKGPLRKIWDKIVLFLLAHIFALVIAYVMGWKTRQRMSHNNGIGAKGKFIVDLDPNLPPNEFWQNGKEFPMRIRHAAATFYDDAMGALRSISIKLADTAFESPFDMNLNNGPSSLFWSTASFLRLAGMRKQRYGVEYQYWYRYYPDGREKAIGTLRRRPTSYTNQIYYSKTPYLWISTDGVKHYTKYKVIPFDDVEESGLVYGNDLIEPENQRITPGETLSRNYLKDEFTDRLNSGEVVKYRLLAQVRKASPDDDFKVFNNMIDWPEDEFPYLQVGILEVTEAMSWDDSNLIAFAVTNLHPTLAIIPATSIHDPNSLNYMRAKGELARKARWLSYKVKGMPPPIPYDDFRNSSSILEDPIKTKSSKLPVWHKHEN